MSDSPGVLRDYVAAGWALVRIPPLTKAPLDNDWPQRDYPPESFAPGDNVGVILGPRSGGLVDVDCDCPEAIALAHLFLPPTLTFGRYGQTKTAAEIPGLQAGVIRHFLYRCPAVTKTHKPTHVHIELRGPGGQTVIPPSIRGVDKGDPPGEQEQPIFWTSSYPVAEMTEHAMFTAFGRLGVATVIARAWPHLQGGRHDAVLAIAGALHGEGWSEDDATAVILPAAALHSPDPGHRAQAIRDTWMDSGRNRYGWPTVAELMGERSKALQRMVAFVPRPIEGGRLEVVEVAGEVGPLTDAGNAERLVRSFGADLRFSPGVGWLRWRGHVWEPGIEPYMEGLTVARQLQAYGRASGLNAVRDHAIVCESEKSLRAAVKLASFMPAVHVKADALDANPWVLNTPAGIIDLHTGEMRPSTREDLCTRSTAVAPGGTCPRFEAFLSESLVDRELILYVLRWLGYCLTGTTREHKFGLWHGLGRNGKGTLLEILQHVMGDYATTIASEVLLAAPGSQHSTGLTELRGRRAIVAQELPEGKRFNEPLIKTLSGGDRITARRMHKDNLTFEPTHKLILSCNSRPIVREQGDAFWSRISLVPWSVSFYGREDLRLTDTLRTEASGILALLLAGCGAYMTHGLGAPRLVTEAVTDYKSSQDVVGQFLVEHFEADEKGWIPRTDIYTRFQNWANRLNQHVYSASALYNILTDRGLCEVPRNGTRGFVGLRIKAADGLRALAG